MISIGCLCFSVFDLNLVHTHELQKMEILPRLLRLADLKIGARITYTRSVDINIDGR